MATYSIEGYWGFIFPFASFDTMQLQCIPSTVKSDQFDHNAVLSRVAVKEILFTDHIITFDIGYL